MPEPLVSYWCAWNEPDVGLVARHLLAAVTEDVEWNDPRDSFTGIAALEAAIRRLRERRPDARFVIASEVDHHHGRLRYRWDMVRRGRTLMEGMDVATLDEADGLLCRIDGFFGEPTPIDADQSGVPPDLRRTGE